MIERSLKSESVDLTAQFDSGRVFSVAFSDAVLVSAIVK